MKFFICTFDSILLGIPSDRIERIIPVNEAQDTALTVSIPDMFRLKDRASVHALVLKAPVDNTVFLVPRIENELEIPEENIQCLPQTLSEMIIFCNGVYFTDTTMILTLDPDKLLENIAL